MFESTESAVALLANEDAPEIDRVNAAGYLRDNRSDEGTVALVQALSDVDYGVHWAASEALASMGDDALVPILEALCSVEIGRNLAEGAKHAFHTSSSLEVRSVSKPVINAMHRPGWEIATMEAASALLTEQQSS